MQALIADVGGTNTRLALTGADAVPRHIKRLENDRFDCFVDLMVHYLHGAAQPVSPSHCCIAIAGPVSGSRARLTNRDWVFDAGEISRAIAGKQPVQVRLVNDLFALGHALPRLDPGQLCDVRTGRAPGNGQALVAGIGTGFNACLVQTEARIVLAAEMGHASLPAPAETFLGRLGIGGVFPTIEHVLSGRGLGALHMQLTGAPMRSAHCIVQAAEAGQGPETRTIAIAAGVLGLIAREFVFQYLPLDGIHFAGSVGRALLGPMGAAACIETFGTAGALADLVETVPLRVITDDAAALTGLAHLVLA